MPGRVRSYSRHVCDSCVRAAKRKRHSRLSDRQLKERRAVANWSADDRRRAEGIPVRKIGPKNKGKYGKYF